MSPQTESQKQAYTSNAHSTHFHLTTSSYADRTLQIDSRRTPDPLFLPYKYDRTICTPHFRPVAQVIAA
jgi:hypothetical protein